MSERVTATFLFTDIVGSTRRRDRLGDDAADQLDARHDRIVAGAIDATGGTLVKSLGDGAMAVFDSAAAAVACALDIQQGIAAVNGESPDDPLEVRIGLNAGEVLRREGDYSGLPVALAARACNAARGGQIVTTRVVRTLVGTRGGFTFRALGATALQGIAEPVELFEVVTDTGGGAPPAPEMVTDTPIPFPAVLARASGTVLVGRSAATAQLDAAFEVAAGGRRHLALVVGEPGIGKTSFVSVWSRRAADRGVQVIAGRCPIEAVTPYQPFVEVVRQILPHRPSLIGRLGPGAADLARLVPDLVELLPAGRQVQADPTTEKYLLFEAFMSLLKAAAENGPVVLLLDDLHWADAPSLSLLEYIVRHPDEGPVFILGTYRDTDLSRAHPLSRLLADLRRERRVERLLLHGLDESQTGALITERLGTPAPDVVVHSVHTETEGNPFFVEEILAHLQEVGAVDAAGRWQDIDNVEAFGIPEGIREVVGRRLDHLDEPTNRLLSVGAVIGREFDSGLLQAVTTENVEVIEDGLEAAVAAGVLEDVPSGVGRFTFSHALIRQSLYEEMPATRRARMHRAVGASLEAADAPPGELAHHWVAGQELPKALSTLVRAGATARSVAAFEDARRLIDLAIEIWDDVDDPVATAGMSHAALLRFAADMHHHGGSVERAAALVRAALDEVDPARDPVLAGGLLERLSRYLWVAGQGAASLVAGREAVELIPSDPPTAERAKALAAVAGLEMLSSRYAEARDSAEEAIRVARRVGATSVEGHALTTLGTVKANLGDIDGGSRIIREGRALAERENSIDDVLRSYANLSSVLEGAGRYLESIAEALEGMELAREYGLMDTYGWFHAGNAAAGYISIGRWDEAEALLDGLVADIDVAVTRINVLGNRTVLAMHRGQFDEVRKLLARSEELGRQLVDPQFVAPVHLNTALLARWEGRPEEALDRISEAIKVDEGSQSWFYSAPLYVAGIGIVADLAEQGPVDEEVMQRAERWWGVIEKADLVAAESVPQRSTGRAELARARGEASLEYWRVAVADWEAISRPYEIAGARWQLGRALASAGEDTAGVIELETSLAEARRLGSEHLVRHVAASLHEVKAHEEGVPQ